MANAKQARDFIECLHAFRRLIEGKENAPVIAQLFYGQRGNFVWRKIALRPDVAVWRFDEVDAGHFLE